MKTPDLKPCPFCGRTDHVQIVSHGFERYSVICLNCQLQHGQWHGLSVAIDAWNMRRTEETDDE